MHYVSAMAAVRTRIWWVVGLALGLCGCGTPAAIWCPTTSRPIATDGQMKANSPFAPSFNARTLLGRTEQHATDTAGEWGCSVRVIQRDGDKFAITRDFRGNRVNVIIKHGVVTSVGVN